MVNVPAPAPGGTLSHTQINQIIQGLDASTPTVVQLPVPAPGQPPLRILTAGGENQGIQLRRSNTVLRGDCSDRRRVIVEATTWAAGGADNWRCGVGHVTMCPPDAGANYPFGWRDYPIFNPTTWTAGFTRGTSQVTVADASAFSPGDLIWLQSNDPQPDVAGVPLSRIQTATYNARVTARSGNQVTLDRPLPYSFLPSGAQAFEYFPAERVGLECLTIDSNHNWFEPGYITPPQSDNLNYQSMPLGMRSLWESWVYNVDMGDSYNVVLNMTAVSRSVVVSNRIGETMRAAVQGQCLIDGNCTQVPEVENPLWNKYAAQIARSHDNSIANNTIHSSIGSTIIDGSSRNWYAYNYMAIPVYHPPYNREARKVMFHHGSYAAANVFEGNMYHGTVWLDAYYDGFERTTFFRNTAFSQSIGSGPGTFQIFAEGANHTESPFLVNFNFILDSFAGMEDVEDAGYNLFSERNVYTRGMLDTPFVNVNSNPPVRNQNHNAESGPLGNRWDSLTFPNTLNEAVEGRVPSFWCQEACPFDVKQGSVGAFWDGQCQMPAQRVLNHLPCTPVSSDPGSNDSVTPRAPSSLSIVGMSS